MAFPTWVFFVDMEPAPQTLVFLRRVQCGAAAAFVAASTVFFMSYLISRIELIALYRSAMFFAIINHGLSLRLGIPVKAKLVCFNGF